MIQFFRFLFLLILAAGLATAQAPKAPTQFKVTVLGSNAFLLEWKDNSNNETGWQVSAVVGTGRPQPFEMVRLPDATSHLIVTADYPGKTLSFQLRAFSGGEGAEVFSQPTPVVQVKAARYLFKAPERLRARRIDDTRIRLRWRENSDSEAGYLIEFREGKKKWRPYATIGPVLKFNQILGGLKPNKNYSFRVRGFRNGVPSLTPYSKIATVRTRPFRSPGAPKAVLAGEGAIRLNWKNRNSGGAGFEIQARQPGEAFRSLGVLGPEATATGLVAGFAFDSLQEFRIRAFRLVKERRVNSPFTPLLRVRVPKLATPTAFALSSVGDNSAVFAWDHQSTRTTGFEIQFRKPGETEFRSAGSYAAAGRSGTVAGLVPVTGYEFRIRAIETSFFPVFSQSLSGFSPVVAATTTNGLIGNFRPPVLVDQGFLYQILWSDPAGPLTLSVTGLPAGLTFDEATRTIRGTPAAAGNRTATLTATFADGTTSTRSLFLNTVTREPRVSGTFAPVTVDADQTREVSIANRFSDPDTPSAVRINTNLGPFDIVLFPDSTPFTVGNFLRYVDEDLYEDMFFHRSPPDFVVQGGGFTHTGADGFNRVPTYPPVVNEPGLSNIRGTVAMAKLGGDPNSATSQFFVNMKDNSGLPPALDSQNGGFTVFGRVADPGMPLIDQINDLPVGDYSVSIDGEPLLLEQVPINAAAAPADLDPADLIKVTSVTDVPILRYEVTSDDPAIATAALDGEKIAITGHAAGTATIEIKAIDLDGLSVTATIAVTVP